MLVGGTGVNWVLMNCGYRGVLPATNWRFACLISSDLLCLDKKLALQVAVIPKGMHDRPTSLLLKNAIYIIKLL